MATSAEKNPPLEEGVDYYLEKGNFVFTSSYLLKRGYCCRSGCRHCPYGFQDEPEVEADRPRRSCG